MLGIGLPEMAVIALVAIFVFGPERLPEFAKQAARVVKQVRSFANNARDELRDELGPEYADMELRDLDPRQIVRRHIAEAMDDLDAEEKASLRPGHAPLEEGEMPPYDADAT